MRMEQLRNPLAVASLSAVAAFGAANMEASQAAASREVPYPADFCLQQARGANINGQAPNPVSAVGFHFPTHEGKPVLNRLVVEGVGNQIGAYCLENVIVSRTTSVEVLFEQKKGGFARVTSKPVRFTSPNAYDQDKKVALTKSYTGQDILLRAVTKVQSRTNDGSYKFDVTCGLERVTQKGQVSQGPCK